jgi:hypothetical protein
MLDLDAGSARGLFLDVNTGRLVWKDLPALRDYAFVAADYDGNLILHGPTGSKNFSSLSLKTFMGTSISSPYSIAHKPPAAMSSRQDHH